MYKTKSVKTLIFLISLAIVFLLLFTSGVFRHYAFADNNAVLEETITLMGKVQGQDEAVVQSPKFVYERADGYTEEYPGDLSGGFMFVMPSEYDCTLTIIADGYNPKWFTFTKEELASKDPVYDLGTIVLDVESWCVVSFNSNGGSEVASQRIKYGDRALQPANPTLDNYSFDAWYIDNSTFATKFDFTTRVTGDITLYAKWNKINVPEEVKPATEIAKTDDSTTLPATIAMVAVILSIAIFVKRTFILYKTKH